MQIKSYISRNKKLKNQFFQIVFIVLVLCSCKKAVEFSDIPFIEFENISKVVVFDEDLQVSVDSITISLKFQDGDGNLGVDQSDLGNVMYRSFSDTSISSLGDTTFTFINYYIDLYRKDNGEFVKFDPYIRLGGSFESLVEYNEVGPIEGTLHYGFKMIANSALLAGFAYNDTVKFDVHIVDRELNVSNHIVTDEIILFEKD